MDPEESNWEIETDHPVNPDVSDHSSDDELMDSDQDNDCLSAETDEDSESAVIDQGKSLDKSNERAGKLFWCKCDRCEVTSEVESFCCKESTLIKRHIAEHTNCVTEQKLVIQNILVKKVLDFLRQLIGN